MLFLFASLPVSELGYLPTRLRDMLTHFMYIPRINQLSYILHPFLFLFLFLFIKTRLPRHPTYIGRQLSILSGISDIIPRGVRRKDGEEGKEGF